ncbi:Vacuolar protein sorting-associated protein 33 [Tetrabaena socialis]|uniref:Vacuolar protein sorting-associated protein 33 n=1 Tax=Tetrabaena socialis TaxID=47790 RepID=A0A2J8A8P0_9CHLO|nr:Vacuolar protein sorting-associated protein 33 [Tetrabaena socialis]|eukprot:PNH08906.1 Vacuolar protein sorting-associated protein 33 [Tetrabaena socialis]
MARLKPGKHQLPTLDTGPVPLLQIREQARRQLLEVVDSRRGKKALILDPAISGPLGLLDASLTELLTEHGVVKLLYLEPGKRLDDPAYNASEPRLAEVRSLIYLVRPSVANAQAVAQQVKSRARGEQHDFSVFFVPRRTVACERVLEEEGILGDIAIAEGAGGGGGGAGAGPDAPSDVSYLYKGYAPLSIRLVETALRTGWGPQAEVLQLLPGNHFDVIQGVDSSGMPVEKQFKAAASATTSSSASAAGSGSSGAAGASGSAGGAGQASVGGALQGAANGGGGGQQQQQPETVLVAFIGGVTYSEISALRFLSSRPEWPYRFLVLTTKIINGRTLLQCFVDPMAAEFGAVG